MKRLMGILALCCAATVAQAETFTFTAIPDQDETRLQERFNKVAAYLSRQLGVEVKYIPVKSYDASVTAFRNNQVQLAWFGGLTGVQARRMVPDSRALAQGIEDQEFVTYFISHKSAGLSPSTDFPAAIAGKTFTFGAKGSTSGRLMPEYFIRKHFNKAPEQVFERVGFSGDHDRTITEVQAGAYQVGALNYTVWEAAAAAGKIEADKVQVIWKSPPYQDYQWTIRGDVDSTYGAGFTDKVQKALLNMTDKACLEAFPRTGFIKATNENYGAIEQIAKEVGLLE